MDYETKNMGMTGVMFARVAGRIKAILWRRPDSAQVTAWVLGLMFCLPFLSYHHRFPLTTFYGEWIAALLGMSSFLYLLRRQCWEPFLLPRVALMPLLLICVLLVQLFGGMLNYPEQGILASAYLLWAMFLMVVAGQVGRRLGFDRLVVVLAWSLVIGSVLSAFAALVQVAGWVGWFSGFIVRPPGGVVFGNLAQANHFSNYAALGLASLLYLFATRRIPWFLTVPFGMLLVYALGLSGSRSSWLYLGLFVALSGGLWWHEKSKTHARLLVSSIVATPLFFALQHVKFSRAVSTSNERLFADLSGGIEPRLYIWEKAFDIFLDHPWLGAGFDQFAWEHFVAVANSGLMARTDEMQLFGHAHNLVLHLLAVMGLAGTGIVVLGLVLWGWGGRKWRIDISHWWMLALLGVIGIHSLLEFPLWYTYFLGVAAVLLGAGETKSLRLGLRPSGRWLLILVMVMGGVSMVNLARSNVILESVLRKPTKLEPEKHDARVNQLLEVHRESLLAPYVEMALSQTIRLDREGLDDKINVNERVVRFAPVATTVYRQAILLALNGDEDGAERLFYLGESAYPKVYPLIAEVLRAKNEELGDLAPWVARLAEQVEARKRFLQPYGEKTQWVEEARKPKPTPFPVTKLLYVKPV